MSLSQDTGLVTPRQVNNFPRASPSSTGDASALERVVGDYRQRILKLEIDIEELKVDVKTLTSDKNKLLSVVTVTSWSRTSAVHGLLSLLFIYFKFNLLIGL